MSAHFHEWVAAGIFFLAISVIEGLLAAALIVLPSRRLCLIAATVSLATMAVWAVSRGTGLPLGPAAGVPEATGLADSASTLFELASAACLVMSCNLTVAPGKAWRVRATIAVVAATALLTGAAIRASGGAHHHAGHSLAGSVSGLPHLCTPASPCR